MKYDFDEIIPRRHTNSYKWDSAADSDVLPLWVADMDFRTAPAITEALADRYGKLPDAAKRLADVHKLRLRCEALGVRKIDAAETATIIVFDEKAKIEPMALITLLQTRKGARMIVPTRLRVDQAAERPEDRLRVVRELLDTLSLSEEEARAVQRKR